jgi:hypothetical protein
VLEDKAVAIEVEQSEFDGKTDDKVKKVVKEVGEDDTAEILEEIETTETIKEAAETGAAETGTTETGAAETIGKKYELLNERIVTVTEENKSEYTLFDVIMPVPGWRVQYPKNEGLKEIYDRVSQLTKGLGQILLQILSKLFLASQFSLLADYRCVSASHRQR